MSKMPGTTLLLAVTAIATQAAAFQTASLLPRSQALQRVQQPRAAAPDEDAETASASLEEKMAGWEASAEEQRKATLGGLIPGKPGFMTRTDQPDKVDGFDVGLGLSGVILLPLALLIASFPIWIGNLDISSAGPPPTN